MTKSIKTPEQIAEAKAKKAAYDKARRARMKAEKAETVVLQAEVTTPKVVKAAVKSPETAPESTKAKKEDWKSQVDFKGAVEVNRGNVKNFYKKQGFIKVVNPKGETLHVGKTINMGKVFSNYVNCANYNQSYNFNLAAGDKLLFIESAY